MRRSVAVTGRGVRAEQLEATRATSPRIARTLVEGSVARRRRASARSSRNRWAFSDASLETCTETDACAENTSSTRRSWSVNVRRSKRLSAMTPATVPL